MAGPQYRQPETDLSSVVPARASAIDRQIEQAKQLVQRLSEYLQDGRITTHERREIKRMLERLTEAAESGSTRRLGNAIERGERLAR